MKYAAIDFETFYDDELSVSVMPVWNYVYHPRFDAYLMAVVTEDFEWVGPPEDFDRWDEIKDHVKIAHNVGFDALVYKKLHEDGVIPHPAGEWVDTADMGVYLRFPRALDKAVKAVYGETIDKKFRLKLKNKDIRSLFRSGDLDPDFKQQLDDYGLDDSRWCYRLWMDHHEKWPADEQLMSKLNREAGWRGVYVDKSLTEPAVKHLQKLLFEAEANIPWEWRDTHKTPAVRAKMIEQCRACGIWYPASFAMDDPRCMEWEDEFADKYAWIKAVRDFRRINMIYQRIKVLNDNIREDGTFAYQCKYFGANTGRMSGGSDRQKSFNMQNIPKDKLFDVDIRPMIKARPGYKFVIIDYAQIEARTLLWVVQDKRSLDLLAQTGNIYETYARTAGLYDKETPLKSTDKKLYAYCKACVLALGFGCGHKKFVNMAARPAYGSLTLTEEESLQAVQLYRGSNPKIKNFWYEMDRTGRLAAAWKESLEIELPSERVLVYYDPKVGNGDLSTLLEYNTQSSRRKVYGALLVENLIQGTARDLLRDGWIALEAAGYKVAFTVHDEYVLEIKEDEVDVPAYEKILMESSPWAKGLPIEIETQVVDHYTK